MAVRDAVQAKVSTPKLLGSSPRIGQQLGRDSLLRPRSANGELVNEGRGANMPVMWLTHGLALVIIASIGFESP